MKRKFSLLGIFLAMLSIGYGQAPMCSDVHIHDTVFNYWEGLMGTYGKPGFPGLVLSDSGLAVDSVHIIMTKAGGYDIVVGDSVLPVVPPDEEYAVKLGNAIPRYGAEAMYATFLVDSLDHFLTYQYAVVLNDPVGHTIEQKPFFLVFMLDERGDTIPFSKNNIIADRNDPRFIPILNGNVVYSKWTKVGLDLEEYVGEEVTIYFVTGDCQQGGHYGYGYFNLSCGAKPLSVDETQPSYRVYPNPTSGKLSVSGLKGSGTLYLYNVSGEKIWNTKINETSFVTHLPDHVPPGIYYLIYSTKGDTTKSTILVMQSPQD